MTVLATRPLPGPAWEELGEVELLGAGWPGETRDDVRALVVANEEVGARQLDSLPGLRLVANFGVGYDRIDVAECARRGIFVSNTPGVLDAATADLAFALILAARRRIVAGDRLVRRGGWTHGWSDARELTGDVAGATIGIVGLGRIGSAVARRARGFDMNVLHTRRTRGGDGWRELDDLLRESDVVTLHLPRTPGTERLIDARRLALLRDGATFVNTARGELVDEAALVRELVDGRIDAGLDVFAHEPRVPQELLDLPNVVLTPHAGSATVSTRAAMTRIVVDNVLAVARGEEPPTGVM